MKRFRLYQLSTARLETYEIGHSPPYIAVSHAWSEQIFLTGVESSFGGTAIRKIIAERLPAIEHCWIDNFCIKQDDEADKLEQIPLMGDIYSHAEVVAIVLACEFGFTQSRVDRATAALQEGVEAWREERWAAEEFLEQWMYGPRRETLVRAMRGLAKLTKSSWGTRIWTLQEYILASSVIWIGSDLSPVIIDDILFQAIPGLCNQLSITECMSSTSEFAVLHTHFSGMANSRLHAIDRTRAMELLGNRKATVPVDEVYGIMACCGVEIMPVPGETREHAWERWWETAMCHGHVRWALLPPTPLLGEADVQGPKVRNCAVPEIGHRGAASAASWLDSVAPLDTVTVSQGVLTLSGRAVGNCTLLRELGSVHQSKKGFLHRDITLILFARGLWSDALQIVEAFGSGRYNKKKQICLAHVFVDNYRKALHHVHRQKETDFRPFIRSSFHHSIWGDFIQLQARCIMDGLNYGLGFLAQIFDPKSGIAFKTVVVVGDYLPTGPLVALDFNAVTSDKRIILLIAEVPAGSFVPGTTGTALSLHKLGTTIPVTNDYRRQWDTLPIESFSLGGSKCHVCMGNPQKQQRPKGKRGYSISRSRGSINPEKVAVPLWNEYRKGIKGLNFVQRNITLRGFDRSRRRFLV